MAMLQFRTSSMLRPARTARTRRRPASERCGVPVCPVHPGRLAGFPLTQYRADDPLGTVYFDAGEGEPVVFIHGLGGNLTHFSFVAPQLASSNRVLGLDLPGFGATAAPARPVSYAFMARSVLALMDRQGVDRAVVTGHSFGGAVALHLALYHPDRIKGVVLVNPAGLHRFPFWMRLGSYVALRPNVTTLAMLASVQLILDGVCKLDGYPVAAFRRSATRLRGGYAFLRGLSRGAWSLRRDLVERTYLDALPRLWQPMHLVWGEADTLLPPTDGQEAVNLAPNARLTLVPGAGHMPIFEAPGTVVGAVREVFERLAAPTRPVRWARHSSGRAAA